MMSSPPTLLHHYLDRAASRDPEHEAFSFKEESLSYGRLAMRSNQLANLLREQGVQPGDRVGIYLNKSIEMPVAVYGILKAGAAYVPIDPAAPASRVAYIIRNCGIRHLVSSGARKRSLQAILGQGVDLSSVTGMEDGQLEAEGTRFLSWEQVDHADDADTDLLISGDDLAYIMYTSGSTGNPKGLMHTHSSGMSYARHSGETYGVRADDRLGNHSPLHFDMSTFEFFTGPSRGATTVIIPEEAMLFPVCLAELIERSRLTFWYSVPLALVQLLNSGQLDNRDCRSLRWVLFGGEPFVTKYLIQLMEKWPHASFSNVYGPAEVNQCSYYHVKREDLRPGEPIPLGRLWDGAEGKILDESDNATRIGETGELLIHSGTMMRGYWGNPELTDQHFHVDPSAEGRRKTYYRTGDLVSLDREGVLHFHGRKDRQVKIRGYRVELDEVERLLAHHETVSEAAVFTTADESGMRVLVGAVLPRDGCSVTEAELRGRLLENLPGYAVPGKIRVMEAFPRTTSGKTDRRALAQQCG